ncbi:Rha family transcriptional regulator [Sphingobium sp. DC-2]|uniref:Rha family transcriptional regulator n=1 Tax=Sphingobium sp. DC-2 TaxID=1303256 RepID=UPI000689F2DC|nr:Rha family transcriptional regulator [Sphingobium sp. DC-2]
MIALVQVRGEAVLASSLDVAQSFEKRHSHVLRSIALLVKERPDLQPNFGLQIESYEAGKGATRQRHHYEMDRKGFTLLAMGFTGARALEWKIAYIDAFDRMEAALRSAVNDDATDDLLPDESPLLEHVRGDDLERKLSLAREIRLAYGRPAIRRMWNSIGLPPVEPDEEAEEVDNVPRSIVAWLNERTERAPGHKIRTQALFHDFRRWCVEQGEEDMNISAFGWALRRAGHRSRMSNGSYRIGLKLRD